MFRDFVMPEHNMVWNADAVIPMEAKARVAHAMWLALETRTGHVEVLMRTQS